MRKDRQSRLVAILALCVSVVGLTLGFAAFSNTLTISSSAIVTPNSEDFKLVAYGLSEEVLANDFVDKALDTSLYTSTTSALPVLGGVISDSNGAISAETALIDNSKITITNLSVTFSEPNQHATYPILIKNEGEYDAYLDLASIVDFHEGVVPTCTAGDGTTENLVNSACKSIKLFIEAGDMSGEDIFGDDANPYKLAIDDSIVVIITISYDDSGERADGPFTAKFEDVIFNYSTTA